MDSIPAPRRQRSTAFVPILLLTVAACSQATGAAPAAPVPTAVITASAPAAVTVTLPPVPQRTSTNGDDVIDSIISVYPLDRVSWGIEVFDPATLRLLYRHGAEKHFIPASNTKIVATSAAMALLGPDWRYHTEVYALGSRTGSVVEHILVVGQGDPTMSERFFGNDFAVLSALADSVWRAGVRRVTRGVIIDATYFDDTFVHPAWEVGDLRSSDAAPVAAVAIGEGTFAAVVRPGHASGQPASVRVLGPAGLVRVRSEVRTDTADARTSIDARLAGDTIVFTGTIALNAPADTEHTALADPVAYAGGAFAAALRERGIDVAGSVRTLLDTMEVDNLLSLRHSRIASWESPPMRDIVAALMKPSANWITEQLCKTLGAAKNDRGSWPSCVAVEGRFLVSAGVDSTAFLLRDGSGLAAQNLLTPHAIVQLLEFDRRAPWGEDYRHALAEPGEKGTLQRRLLPLKGRLWAKTGSITNVNSLSGYLKADSGKMLIFSIMSNGSGRTASEVRRAMDAIVMRITNAW
jgi:D-alanyl-D-alanine carboxypeptidase/D-alanyl-D-alanine-endopeptidase (penicillin-binding protein 4)